MTRSKTDSPTRQKLLDSALKLMLDNGFAATSVGEICEAAGVTKGSFFHYFDSKEALGVAVLHHYWQPLRQKLLEGEYQTAEDPLERVLGYCDFVIQLLEHPLTPKSCLFGNFAQELSTASPEIRAVCQEAFTWWTGTLQEDLEAAREKHPPARDIDPNSLAELFVAVYEGALILAKAYQDPGRVRKHLDHLKQYLSLLYAQGDTQSLTSKPGDQDDPSA